MKVLANVSVVPVWICANSDRLPTYVSGTLYLEEEEAFIGLRPELNTVQALLCCLPGQCVG
jgi:hypothetical protein